MYVGFALAVAIFLPRYSATPAVLVVSGLAMAVLAIDDRWPMKPIVKFGVQIALGALAVIVFAVEIRFVSLPGGQIVQLGWLIAPISIF